MNNDFPGNLPYCSDDDYEDHETSFNDHCQPGGCLKIKSYRYIIESYKNRTICKLFHLWYAQSKHHEFHMIYKIHFLMQKCEKHPS